MVLVCAFQLKLLASLPTSNRKDTNGNCNLLRFWEVWEIMFGCWCQRSEHSIRILANPSLRKVLFLARRKIQNLYKKFTSSRVDFHCRGPLAPLAYRCNRQSYSAECITK